MSEEANILKRIGRRLKGFRLNRMKEGGMKKKEFALRAGMSEGELAALEAGELAGSIIPVLVRISSAHGLNLMYLFEGKINYQARKKIISGLVKRIVEERSGRCVDYLRLLTCMQDPGFEKLIFGFMEAMLEKCSKK